MRPLVVMSNTVTTAQFGLYQPPSRSPPFASTRPDSDIPWQLLFACFLDRCYRWRWSQCRLGPFLYHPPHTFLDPPRQTFLFKAFLFQALPLQALPLKECLFLPPGQSALPVLQIRCNGSGVSPHDRIFPPQGTQYVPLPARRIASDHVIYRREVYNQRPQK